MSDENEQTARKGKGPLLIAVVGAVNLLAIGGVGFFLYGKQAAGDPVTEGSAKVAAINTPGPVVQMDSFIVNVSDGDALRYLKAQVVVELKEETAKARFDEARLLLRNEILMHLSSLDVRDTRTTEQKRAIERRLVELLNGRLGGEEISGIYFTEFVTQ